MTNQNDSERVDLMMILGYNITNKIDEIMKPSYRLMLAGTLVGVVTGIISGRDSNEGLALHGLFGGIGGLLVSYVADKCRANLRIMELIEECPKKKKEIKEYAARANQ